MQNSRVDDTEKQAKKPKRTNVLDDKHKNVSRETLISEAVSHLPPDENVDDTSPTIKELYRSFRKNGLNVIDSGYNALYLKCCDKYYSSGVGVKEKYKNVYIHPSAWYSNATTMWRHNQWSLILKLLETPVTLRKLRLKMKNAAEAVANAFVRNSETSGSVGKSVTSLLSVMLVGGAVVMGVYLWNEIADNMSRVPALEVYIDGEHVGNVQKMSDVEAVKKTMEASVSMNLGISYVLDCDIDYQVVRAEKSLLMNEAKINKVLHEATHENMILGYCLYKGDLPICAVEDKTMLEECIDESVRLRYPDLIYDENVKNVGYKDFLIVQGSYPKNFFVDEEQLRSILSIPSTEEKSKDKNEGVELGNTLINSHAVGTSSDVTNNVDTDTGTISVAIETVVTKTEFVREQIPFVTEYVYDDNLPEGLSTPISTGRNGLRNATYSVEYTDGKETSRRLIDEEIVSEPIKEVRKLGTRPLTEEEKAYKSTGTYIYPSQGTVTSVYGWRVLGGRNEFHKGLDMRSDKGLELVASDGGVVIQASDIHNGYGLCVMIQHDDGTITRYAHCSELYVAENQKVKQGQPIGKMGSTGFATGVHVHFEMIRNGTTINPMPYMIG